METQTVEEIPARPVRWILLLSVWALSVTVGAYVVVPASVLPIVMTDLTITESLAGWLVSIPQLTAALVGIPVGILLDRRDTKKIILVAVIVFVFAAVWGWLAGISGRYWLLLASRFLGGFTLVTVWLAGTDFMSLIFAPESRATALSIFVTGYPAGYAFGFLIGPQLTTRAAWPFTFVVFGALAVGTTLVFSVVARSVTGHVATDSISLEGIRTLFNNRKVWAVCSISFIIYSLYMMYVSWMPTFISAEYDIAVGQSSLFVALFPAVGIVSRVVGGIASDTVFHRRRRPVIVISLVGTTLSTAGIFLGSSLFSTIVWLTSVGFFIQLGSGIILILVQDHVPASRAGTAISMVSVVGWFATFISPGLTGFLFVEYARFDLIFGLVAGMTVLGLGILMMVFKR